MGLEPTYPIELTPPNLEAYRQGSMGIGYIMSFDSGLSGPHVMVNAIIHGNELCGAIALDHLLRQNLRPLRGKLSFSFANVAAYLSFNPRNPNASRFVDEDLNRLWDAETLEGGRDSTELVRARALRPFIDAADFLLDIHSMQHSSAPLMLAGMTRKALDLARRLGAPQHIIRDEGHAAGKRLIDYGGFADPASPKTALLIECGQHWAKTSAETALDVTKRFLAATGMLEENRARTILGAPARPQRIITVTHAITFTGSRFEFAAPYRGLEVIGPAGTLIAHDDGQEIRTPYNDCILVMPSRRVGRGQTAVRLGRFTP